MSTLRNAADAPRHTPAIEEIYRRMLDAAGFGASEAYDTATQRPFQFDSARLCLAATKER